MQKVSKQSLAMIALSILLAISIALTFTFAVAQSTKTAKGTITFSGTAALTLTGFGAQSAGNDGTFSISVTSAGATVTGAEGVNALSGMKFALAGNSAPAYVKVVLSVEGANVDTKTGKAVAATLKQGDNFGEVTTNSITTTKKLAAGTTWTLDDILSLVADVQKYTDESTSSTVTLTFTASTNSDDLA